MSFSSIETVTKSRTDSPDSPEIGISSSLVLQHQVQLEDLVCLKSELIIDVGKSSRLVISSWLLLFIASSLYLDKHDLSIPEQT